MGGSCVRPLSDDVAGSVDPGGDGPGSSGKIDRSEGAAVTDEPDLSASVAGELAASAPRDMDEASIRSLLSTSRKVSTDECLGVDTTLA